MKNCGSTVQSSLRAVEGVRTAFVSFEEKKAVVVVHSRVHDLEELKNECVEAVDIVGFEASNATDDEATLTAVLLAVQGMMCMKNCGSTVKAALAGETGVEDTFIDLDAKCVAVLGMSTMNVHDLVDAVEMVGFDAELWDESFQPKPPTPKTAPAPVVLVQDEPVVLVDVTGYRAFFSISGMSCASCVKSIETVLMQLPGVMDCKVGLIAQKAEVCYDEGQISPEEIVQHINDAGYEAKFTHSINPEDDSVQVTLRVQGMTCSACVAKIEKCVGALPGVETVSVNLPLRRAQIQLSQMSETGPRTLIETIQSIGYSAELMSKQNATDDLKEAGEAEVMKWRKLLRNALVFAAPAMIVHMLLPQIPVLREILMTKLINHLTLKCVVLWLLATPIQFGIGKRFYIAAYKGLQHGMMGMDFLIVLGTTASYMYSLVSMALCTVNPDYRGHYFFESSAMLLTFVTFGKYLESVAKGRTVDALAHLMSLQPHFAILVNEKEQSEREIPIELVQRNDLLRIAPGSSIPIDGTIIQGATTVDESMITGESMPVTKKENDYVFGSTLNQHGTILVRAKYNGGTGDSALSQICNLIQEAQTNKAPIQAYADRIAGVFAPVVISIAVVTFAVWYIVLSFDLVPQKWRTDEHDNFLFSLLFSISVVVIACPCALGLATPTAVMVGCGVGAKNGILIKGGGSLETANAVDTVVFDKTGTLTMGRPSVTDIVVLDKENYKPREMLYFVGSAESASEHPLGRSIVATAVEQERLKLTTPTEFHVKPGRGLQCKVDETVVYIGNVEWMEEKEIVLSKRAEKAMIEMESDGKTVVCVALNGSLTGFVSLADQPRTETRRVIDALHERGVQVWMVTGDNLRTATAIARAMGIDHVKAVALPGEKVNQIKSLQAQGRVVAMVGDGINDAPGLAQADVGIAIGAGTEIAVAQADMILVKSNLCDVVIALDLARVVFSRIKLNFLFSMGYNIIGIPVAAGVFFPIFHATLPPACAGLAMAFSSVSVVVSSLLLKRYTPPDLMSKGKQKESHSILPSLNRRKYERLQVNDS